MTDHSNVEQNHFSINLSFVKCHDSVQLHVHDEHFEGADDNIIHILLYDIICKT